MNREALSVARRPAGRTAPAREPLGGPKAWGADEPATFTAARHHLVGGLAPLFVVLGLLFCATAATVGGWAWLLLWPAVSLLLAAMAYFGVGGLDARVFGKRPDGTFALPVALPMLPFMISALLLWGLRRGMRREACYHEFAPGFFVGRRATAAELPPATATLIDLTSELWEPRGVRCGRHYVCCPTLDTRAPTPEAFVAIVRAAVSGARPVYIHCASGHGRAPTVAAGALLAMGSVATTEEAVAALQAARPRVRLKPVQRRLLERTAAELLPATGRSANATPPRHGATNG